MCRIKDMRRQGEYVWSLVYDGQQYVIQMEQNNSKSYIYIYNDVVGGYQMVTNSKLIDQIVSQLDFEEMIQQGWIEEGEEPQEEEDDELEQC